MARTDQRALPVALMVVAAVLLVVRFVYRPDEKKPLVAWMSPSAGLELAKTSGKPLMYDFTAEWCGPCDTLDEEVFRDPLVASEINARFIAVRVTDRQREEGKNPAEVEALQQRYAVRGFPTVLFTDPNGTERGRIEGFNGRDHFEKVMERIR